MDELTRTPSKSVVGDIGHGIVKGLVRGQNPEIVLVTVCQSLRGDGSTRESINRHWGARG